MPVKTVLHVTDSPETVSYSVYILSLQRQGSSNLAAAAEYGTRGKFSVLSLD